MYLELIIWTIIGAFILLLVTTCLLEKLHIHDFVPAPGGEPSTDSSYFSAMNDAAKRLGFTAAGVFIQKRNSQVYQAQVALWLSPERDILLQVGGGKTAGVYIKRTILSSIIESEQIIQTQDDFGMADLSGLTRRKILVNADLDELLSCHHERLASCLGQKRSFSVGTAFADWESIRAMKAEQMARMGLAKFLNREQTIYRHTLKGAWLQYYKGFRSQLAEGKDQTERIFKKRPGSTL
jgi:hypothetical protein